MTIRLCERHFDCIPRCQSLEHHGHACNSKCDLKAAQDNKVRPTPETDAIRNKHLMEGHITPHKWDEMSNHASEKERERGDREQLAAAQKRVVELEQHEPDLIFQDAMHELSAEQGETFHGLAYRKANEIKRLTEQSARKPPGWKMWSIASRYDPLMNKPFGWLICHVAGWLLGRAVKHRRGDMFELDESTGTRLYECQRCGAIWVRKA